MSRENVEFVRNLFDASASMNKAELLAALPDLIPQIAAPDVEWFEDPRRPDARVRRGHAGVLDSWREWLDQWDEYEAELEQLTDCGDDVHAVARETARGRASGVPVESRIYFVITVRDGKVARFREFYDEAASRTAAGLPASSPAGGSPES